MHQLSGVIGIAIALGLVFASRIASQSSPDPAVGAVGVVVLGAAVWWLMAFRPSTYAVELSNDGLRRPADGKWTPWSSAANLSERMVRQRVDILDRHGERLASLHYRLQSFADALEQTVAAVQLPVPNDATFRRSVNAWLAIPVVAALGLWSATSGQALLLPALVLAAIVVAAIDIRSVTVAPEGITVRSFLRAKRFAWTEVMAVRFALRQVGRGKRMLDVRIESSSGRSTRVRPHGVDAFRLYARINEELRRRNALASH